MRKIKAIELFAGVGGMALGLQQAGLDVVAAVEKDKSCVETLKANKAKAFPNMDIIQADITTLTGAYILDKVGLAKGELDVLSGGPPCQGFTYASSRRSVNDPRSKMMWQYIRMVKEIQPRYFVIENVRGLMSFKDFFRTLLKTLEKCGYVVRFNLLDAASYGVPQRRLRVFIDGARSDLNIIPKFPAPTHFDLDKKAEKSFPPASLVAVKCFATNGFTRDEVDDVWFNTRLEILMNKKKAAVQIEQAVNTIVIETVFEHIEKNSGEKLMAKKKAKSKSKVVKGEQMPLIEVGPENLKNIVKKVREYDFHKNKRLFHLKKEVEYKNEIKGLVDQAHLTRLKNGNIRFEAEGDIVEVIPRDDLITIKKKETKKTKAGKTRGKSNPMKDQVKADEMNFEKKNKKD